MVYSARPGRVGASDIVYGRAAHPYVPVDVAGTRHLDVTDMVSWRGPLRERPVLGTVAAERMTEIARTVVRQYFDEKLSGSKPALLHGADLFPEVAVKTFATAYNRRAAPVK